MDPDPNPMPDFVAEEAFLLRGALIDAFGWNKEQAIQHLQATWRQVHLEPPAQPPQDCPENKEDQLMEQPGGAEQPGDWAKQAQDKKKPTIEDFEEDAPPPNVIASWPSQYALQKITAFRYVELWYFMKDGCFKAMKQAHLQADDAFGLASTNEILTLCPVTSVKASKYAKADNELSLTEILQAWTLYLEHLKEAGWPEKHISALFKFF